MEIPIVGNCLGRLPLVFLASFVLWFPLFYFFSSVYMVGNIPGSLLNGNFANSAIPGESNFFHVPLYSDGNTSDFTDPVEEADDSISPLIKGEEKLRTSGVETDGIVEKSVDFNSVKKTEPYLQAIDTSEEKEDEASNRVKTTSQSNVETNGFVKKIADFNSGKEIDTSEVKEDEEFNRGKTTSQSHVGTDGFVKKSLDFNSGKELDTSERREEEEEEEAFSRGKTTSRSNVETDGFVKKSPDFNSVKEQEPYSPSTETSEKKEEANNRDKTTPQRPEKKNVDLDSVKEPEPPAIDTSNKKEEEAFTREKITSQSHVETDVFVNKSVDFNSVKKPETHSPAIDKSEKKEKANNRDKTTPQRPVKKSVELDSVKEPEPLAIDTSEKKEEAFNRQKTTAAIAENQRAMELDSHNDSCFGRYIFVHHIPAKFNDDLLKNCRSLSTWTDMCEFTSNNGLGPRLPNTERVYSNNDWFATNQFSLEVIFHNKMKNYQCLTTNSSKASAIFVPYYAGLDVARYLWGYNSSVRDRDSQDLVRWLRQKPEWKAMSGRDHFLVAGRITWDFRRPPEENPDWGNRLLDLPESKKMTMLVIESSPWKNNDFAIPYPTYFHPSNDAEILWWQNRMRRLKRQSLFSFVGSRRPNLRHSIRNEIINQCEASNKTCTLLECSARVNKCYKPVYIMKMFQSSVFCLQPPGDSFTRRSAFDSILAGCIPVFFHPGSAYVQYIWHLPKDHKSYSVLIPANEVKSGSINIEKVLMKIPRRKVIAMREEVIKLIPKIVYANPTSRLERFEDAFDITVKGVIDRVDRIRKEAAEGKSKRIDYAEKISWKYVTFGTVEQHEWDPFFNGSLERES